MMRSFKARYPGTCVACRGEFLEGIEIRYDKGRLGYAHVTCPGPPATAPIAQPATVDVSGVLALLRGARDYVRHPKIRLQTADGRSVALSIAGARARVPGSVTVADACYGGAYYGRILPDGSWQEPRGGTPPEVITLVRELATKPVETAAAYGHLTGSCCFCGRQLTDERSTGVGYGPICAGHYGLPWGA